MVHRVMGGWKFYSNSTDPIRLASHGRIISARAVPACCLPLLPLPLRLRFLRAEGILDGAHAALVLEGGARSALEDLGEARHCDIKERVRC